MVRGVVFDLQRFSLHDGPGIRTTVFLKGCPLRCLWCHNPEAMQRAPQCVGAEVIGQEMTAEAVLHVADRDTAYYARSGGGLTISGGEPLFQPDFTRALLDGAKTRGWHTCLDTSGFATVEVLAAVQPLVDLFLFDIKAHDDAQHRMLTGQSNAVILARLDWLMQREAAVILRCPLIPGMNDGDAHLAFIARLAHAYPGLRGVQIMPYHAMAAAKWRRIGQPFALEGQPSADAATQSRWIATLRDLGIQQVTAG